MFYDDDNNLVWETEDGREYDLVGGPFDGQSRNHFPDSAVEGQGFDEPFPFESAKWQADPERMTKCAQYRWNSELEAFEYKGSFEWKLGGFSTLSLGGDEPKLTKLEPLV